MFLRIFRKMKPDEQTMKGIKRKTNVDTKAIMDDIMGKDYDFKTFVEY